MRYFLKRIGLLAALYMMTIVAGYAQKPSKVEIMVNELVKKYEDVKGVDCISVGKGRGLGVVKLMFTKEFGKDFMKGVTDITIIHYSDASKEVCQQLRKELDLFLPLLKEFNLNGQKEFAEHDHIRSFASVSSDEKTISDFIVALENEDSKMLMYMAGEIKIE